MKTLVVFTEEKSAQVMLQSLMPRLLPEEECRFQCFAFEGKQDLKKQLPIKLRGWQAPNTQFVVLCDQDSSDCKALKKELQKLCRDARKPATLVRIACRELESWYFGDLASVGAALVIDGLSTYGQRAKYRIPDSISNPARELKRITRGRYQKVGGSRAIGRHLSLLNSQSTSFQHFIKGVCQLVGVSENQQRGDS